MTKIGRNDPCPCNSGKKYKKCCGAVAKPVGTTGVTKLTFAGGAATSDFQKLEFPKTKGEIEKLIVGGFVRSIGDSSLLPSRIANYVQNRENDLDFTITLENGDLKLMELMEVAPLENVPGAYDSAPKSYNSYDFGKRVFDKVMAKSVRYSASSRLGLMLLMYTTDWRFTVHESVMDLLRYWAANTQHSFEKIVCYFPVSLDDGIVEAVFPCPPNLWEHVNPDLYKQRTIVNMDPAAWKIG